MGARVLAPDPEGAGPGRCRCGPGGIDLDVSAGCDDAPSRPVLVVANAERSLDRGLCLQGAAQVRDVAEVGRDAIPRAQDVGDEDRVGFRLHGLVRRDRLAADIGGSAAAAEKGG